MLASVIRELHEEAGITVREEEVRRVGINHYHYDTKGTPLEVHVFVAHEFTGDPTESEEMQPKWFPLDQIPIDEMWADDPYWLPQLLRGDFEGKEFEGTFFFKVCEL